MKHSDDNKTLQQLIEEVQSPDVLTRYAAALDLGELGDTRAVEPLIAALSDAEGYVAGAAAMALGQIGDPQAVAPLVAKLEGGDDRLAYPARDESGAITGTFINGGIVARALGKLGEPGFQALLTILHDYGGNEYVGGPAAYRLGELGDRRAIPALIAAFHSDVYEVRAAGADALASFGEDALSVLLDILRMGLAEWNSSLEPLVDALRRIGEPAVEPLIGLLRTSDDEDVRMVAVEVLGGIALNSDSLMESLHSVLREALRSALRDNDEYVRGKSALHLADIHDVSGLSVLLAMLDREDAREHRLATYALWNIGTEAVEPLLAILADTSRKLQARVRAVEALGKIGDTRAIPGLLAALTDDDRRIRMAAENALGELKGQEAMESLRKVLASAAAEDDAEERVTTLVALTKVSDTSVIPALLDVIASSVDENGSPRGSLAQGMSAARALADLKEPGLEALRTIVAHGNRWTAWCALHALDVRDESAQPILQAAARDPRPEIRGQALSALWQWWDDTLTEQCLSDLHDADPNLRRAAAKALEWHAKALPVAATEPLIAALEDEDLWVRYHAARALRVVGDERAIQPLLRCRANVSGKMPASDLKSDCMAAVIAIFHRSRAMNHDESQADG